MAQKRRKRSASVEPFAIFWPISSAEKPWKTMARIVGKNVRVQLHGCDGGLDIVLLVRYDAPGHDGFCHCIYDGSPDGFGVYGCYSHVLQYDDPTWSNPIQQHGRSRNGTVSAKNVLSKDDIVLRMTTSAKFVGASIRWRFSRGDKNSDQVLGAFLWANIITYYNH